MEWTISGKKLIILQGDITEMDTDAIVNAANKDLILGAGVAGAIRTKGGPTIQEECNRIGGTTVGGAVITTGGKLKARYVIHAVGARMGEGEEDRKLIDATRNSLVVAHGKALKSIAFPAISTGIFGFPKDVALASCWGRRWKPCDREKPPWRRWSSACGIRRHSRSSRRRRRAFMLVLVPNVWAAVDAGIPSESKKTYDWQVYNAMPEALRPSEWSDTTPWYFGAFGYSLPLPKQYFPASWSWYSQQDTDLAVTERPAFLSWWDYGFEALQEGQHPTVADNFQNGYQFAGNYITCTDETEAIAMLIRRCIEYDDISEGSAISDAMASHGVNMAEVRNILQNRRSPGSGPGWRGDGRGCSTSRPASGVKPKRPCSCGKTCRGRCPATTATTSP